MGVRCVYIMWEDARCGREVEALKGWELRHLSVREHVRRAQRASLVFLKKVF